MVRLLPRAMLTLTATPLVVIALVAISERASVVGGFSRYVEQVEAVKLALAVPRLHPGI